MSRDDPDDYDNDNDDREDRGFSFRQRLSGLLDPDGAFGKSREYVADLASGTKSEVVRMVSREVRTFLDQMDTVDLMQQVIAGLVIDVNAQIRFSFEDEEGKRELKSRITHKETRIRSRDRKRGNKRNGNGNGNGNDNGNGNGDGDTRDDLEESELQTDATDRARESD